jgi:mono/diheme cytochrome c family protein
MAFKAGELISEGGLAMSMSKMVVTLIAGLLAPWAMAQDLHPMLGQPIERLPQATIGPGGAGLPAGSGSVEEGEVIYRNQCLACHGPKGLMPGNALAGGVGSLSGKRPNKTVGSFWPYATTLFDYIHRAMPYGREKMLSDSEIYGVTAYILFLNDIVPENTRMDATSLPKIIMPNRQGFQSVYQISNSD